jgi:hypothetical protein
MGGGRARRNPGSYGRFELFGICGPRFAVGFACAMPRCGSLNFSLLIFLWPGSWVFIGTLYPHAARSSLGGAYGFN